MQVGGEGNDDMVDGNGAKIDYLERFGHHLERAWHFANMGEATLAFYHRQEARDNFGKVRGHALLARFDKEKIEAELKDIDRTAFARGAEYYSARAKLFEEMGRADFAADDSAKAATCRENAGPDGAHNRPSTAPGRYANYVIKKWFE